MAVAVRSSVRKLFVVALVVTALWVGYAVRGDRSAAPGRARSSHAITKKFTASDLLLIASSAQGIHMHYPGVTIGASLPDHSTDVPLTSFQFGLSRAMSTPVGGGRVAAKPNVSEITLSHQTDTFSIPLLNLAVRGGTGVTVSLFFTDLSGPGGIPFDYLQVDLQQTLVSQFQISSGGDLPSEAISLNFVVMTFRYRVSGGATQTVSYNLATQT